MIIVRNYKDSDWTHIERIHDSARKIELALAGLAEAFLPFRIAAEREDFFSYPGLYVAELDGEVCGFAACDQEELAWLYVDPSRMRQGIGGHLVEHAMEEYPGIHAIEALKGNEPARKLYEKLGFAVIGTERGRMPGNEEYIVEVYCMEKKR